MASLKPAPAAHPASPRGASRTPLRPVPGAAPHPRQDDLDRLDRLADLLDTRWRIPVLNVRFGLDAVLGLAPGAGDVASLLPTLWMIREGRRMGVSRRAAGRMAANAALDFAFGSIPVLGSVWDIYFKANRRNIALLRAEIARTR